MLAAGCRADIVVDIDISHDGAGTVTVEITFDEEVMRWVPDLGDLLITDDLTKWHIRQQELESVEGLCLSDIQLREMAETAVQAFQEDAPAVIAQQLVMEVVNELRTADGQCQRVTTSRRFADPDELSQILTEVDQSPDGSPGLFRGVSFVAARDGARVLYDLTVTVGLDRPVAGLVNPATADALEGELFGLPIDEIEARAGAPLDELVTLVVQATVPQGAGRLPVDGVMTLNEGGTRVLRVSGELFDAEIAGADAEAERLAERASRGARIAVIWWIVLGLVVVVAVVVALRSRRRRLMFR